MKVSGTISEIRSRIVGNGGTVFDAVIDGTDVNLGFQCDYAEGEFVELDVESTKWGLQALKKGGKGKPASSYNSGAKAGTGATPRQAPIQAKQMFPVDPNTKDHSIIRQNALTNANTAVRTAADLGLLKACKTPGDVYNEIIKVAYNLSGFAMGTLDAKLIEEVHKEEARKTATKADTNE